MLRVSLIVREQAPDKTLAFVRTAIVQEFRHLFRCWQQSDHVEVHAPSVDVIVHGLAWSDGMLRVIGFQDQVDGIARHESVWTSRNDRFHRL